MMALPPSLTKGQRVKVPVHGDADDGPAINKASKELAGYAAPELLVFRDGPTVPSAASFPWSGQTGGTISATITGMDQFAIIPPIIVKDTPKPRRLTTLEEARDYVGEAMQRGRPAPWREVWHRLKIVTNDDETIEAMGDLRELLIEEDLLLPDSGTR
jgi:hypothetical protein